MRSGFDFSSWQGAMTTVLSLALVALVMVGVRLLVMQTVQRRREGLESRNQRRVE